MMIMITVLPCNGGKSVMKSMAMCDQGHCGTGRRKSLPAGMLSGGFM